MTRVRVEETLEVGTSVTVDADQAHHLSVVLRVNVGDAVDLIDGVGSRWAGRVARIIPLTVEVLAPREGPTADLGRSLELWVPLLKGGKTDDLVRQLTELGVTAVVCFTATRSVARLASERIAKRVARWESIASEATRQCGRVHVPSVRFSAELPTEGPGVFLWEEEGEPAHAVLAAAAERDSVRVLVGPEGGLAQTDAETLTQRGWSAASLGPRILRAETAVVAAATLALAALSEGGYGA